MIFKLILNNFFFLFDKKLKIGDLADERQRELESVFAALDHDQDGHLNFDILERKYCSFLNESQRSFFYQVNKIYFNFYLFWIRIFYF